MSTEIYIIESVIMEGAVQVWAQTGAGVPVDGLVGDCGGQVVGTPPKPQSGHRRLERVTAGLVAAMWKSAHSGFSQQSWMVLT